jgi:transposase InsO family protein
LQARAVDQIRLVEFPAIQHNRRTRPTKIAARLAVGDWIERIYNRRRHSKIGMISPVESEHRHNQTAQDA